MKESTPQTDGIEGDFNESLNGNRRNSLETSSPATEPNIYYGKEASPSEESPLFRSSGGNGKKEPPKFIVYRKTTCPGWNLVKVTYYS